MASLPLLPSLSGSSSRKPLQGKKKTSPFVHVSNCVAYTSCEGKQNEELGREIHVTDRRNVLLGLGGLYGATTTIGTRSNVAIGAPLQPPNLSLCQRATDSDAVTEADKLVPCCPPYSSANIVDFVPPSPREPLRMRKPAHKMSKEDLEKYKEAVRLMKALDEDDPWNFYQQATIHCTYCNGAFNQVGFEKEKVLLQIHGSWFFLPWHRYYLYFWEKILGKLIGDPTFAIPYWNWDTPKGMYMPDIYLDKSSPLYNKNRDTNHYKALLDYGYAYGDPNPTTRDEIEDVTTRNLYRIHNMFKESVLFPVLFMGKPLSAGEKVPETSSGSLENLHNTMHQWAGPTIKPYHDMGNFYTAARDTMFFGHHANIDRMWDIFSNIRGNKPEFGRRDWHDSAFIFYDENRQVVKVKVTDCLTAQQLRYAYSPEQLPWMDVRGLKKLKAKKKKIIEESKDLKTVSEFGRQPRPLKDTIHAMVTRSRTSRSVNEKEESPEVLVIEGVDIPQGTAARFDVYVAKPLAGGKIGKDFGEHAGSFVKIPHTHDSHAHMGGEKYSSLEMGITKLLEDIEAEGSDKLVVTLVPRVGIITIGGVHVELFEDDSDSGSDFDSNSDSEFDSGSDSDDEH